MQRVKLRKKQGLACNTLLMPNVMKKVNEHADQARELKLSIKSEMHPEYEIEDYSFTFLENMETRTCNCNRWQVSGIPCRHAWLVINNNREDAESYVSANHTTAAYRLAYDFNLHAIPDHRFWPNDLTEDVCSPPEVKKQRGRPCVTRHKHPSEGNQTHRRARTTERIRRPPKCSKCGETGHNARSLKCPALVCNLISACISYFFASY